MAIWLRAREEFADNRFQLLFIYIDTLVRIYDLVLQYKRINIIRHIMHDVTKVLTYISLPLKCSCSTSTSSSSHAV